MGTCAQWNIYAQIILNIVHLRTRGTSGLAPIDSPKARRNAQDSG